MFGTQFLCGETDAVKSDFNKLQKRKVRKNRPPYELVGWSSEWYPEQRYLGPKLSRG
jgi:hypothetical protein